MSEKKETYEDEIQRLITDVETIRTDLNDIVFRGMIDAPYLIVGLFIVFVVIPIMATMKNGDYAPLLVSSTALVISASLWSVTLFHKWDRAFSSYKAGRMCKSSKYNEEEAKKKEETKVLLTALIFMKVRLPKTKLSTIYKLDPEAFTKHNLIQSLYE